MVPRISREANRTTPHRLQSIAFAIDSYCLGQTLVLLFINFFYMEGLKTSERKVAQRTYVGRAWINQVKQGQFKGETCINIKFNTTIKDEETGKVSNLDEIVVDPRKHSMFMWKNEKREGINEKTGKPFRDADFSVSLVLDDTDTETEVDAETTA